MANVNNKGNAFEGNVLKDGVLDVLKSAQKLSVESLSLPGSKPGLKEIHCDLDVGRGKGTQRSLKIPELFCVARSIPLLEQRDILSASRDLHGERSTLSPMVDVTCQYNFALLFIGRGPPYLEVQTK